jgi:pimeloyl-ACP methyl ester carboxylesterase
MTILLVILVLGIAVTRLARNVVHTLAHPQRNVAPTTPSAVGITHWEEVDFRSDNLTLKGWFIPPQENVDGATLLYVHGLGGNRSNLLYQAAHLHKHGYGAFLIDLRNSGQSEGNLTTLSYQEANDVHAAIAYLQTHPKTNPTRIGAIGHSMGGAAVIRAAMQTSEIHLIIIQSTYSSIQASIDEGIRRIKGLSILPMAFLITRFFKKETGVDVQDISPINDLIHLGPRPILFIHGKEDDAVDFTHSERMYAVAAGPKQICLIPNAGHIDHLNENLANSWEAITSFVVQYL